jgi:hypothetical protein
MRKHPHPPGDDSLRGFIQRMKTDHESSIRDLTCSMASNGSEGRWGDVRKQPHPLGDDSLQGFIQRIKTHHDSSIRACSMASNGLEGEGGRQGNILTHRVMIRSKLHSKDED